MMNGERFPSGTSRRFCRYSPSVGVCFILSQTTARTVFQIKNAIWRESCPRKIGMGVCDFIFPIIQPHRPQKGGLTFAYTIGAFFCRFWGFWMPPPLTTKAFVLLNTLHILHQVPRLTLQEGADCVKGFPRYQFPVSQLLEIGLTYQFIFTDFRGCVALLFEFCHHIHLVTDCHSIHLLSHCPYSIIE